jgi:hypothetical protein
MNAAIALVIGGAFTFGLVLGFIWTMWIVGIDNVNKRKEK